METKIDVAYPEASDLHLKLGVGACRIKVSPGDSAAWVAGTYDDLSGALPCKVEQQGGMPRIT